MSPWNRGIHQRRGEQGKLRRVGHLREYVRKSGSKPTEEVRKEDPPTSSHELVLE